MKVFITVIILIFSLQSWTKADDIKDFEIEGMRVGESALTYFSKEEIENGKQPQQYPGSDRYIISNIFEHKNFKKFVQIQINYLKNDTEYKMGGILGSAPYDDIQLSLMNSLYAVQSSSNVHVQVIQIHSYYQKEIFPFYNFQ